MNQVCPYCSKFHSLTESNIYCSQRDNEEQYLENNLFHIQSEGISANDHISRFTFRYSFAGYQHFEIDGYNRTIHPNSLLFIENGQKFSTNTFSGSNVELMTVSFNSIFFQGTLELVTHTHEELLNNPITDFSIPSNTLIQGLSEETKSLLNDLKKSMITMGTKSQLDIQLEALIMRLFLLKSKQNENALLSIDSLKKSTKIELLKRLTIGKDYLISSLQNAQTSIEDTCQEVGMSKYHFIRLFKKLYGIPPHQYLKVARIRFAKDLLKNSTMDISDIATKSGYDSPSAFSRVFKQLTTIPPLQYRK